jgi:hypothetical protein
MSPAAAARPGRWREARLMFQSMSATASHARQAVNTSQTCIVGTNGGESTGGKTERAVVVNVTVAVAGFVPSSVLEGGETVHVACAGAPVQLHVTVCVEPCRGAADTVKFVCCPAVMVAVDGATETL